jgi:hypothetical protein
MFIKKKMEEEPHFFCTYVFLSHPLLPHSSILRAIEHTVNLTFSAIGIPHHIPSYKKKLHLEKKMKSIISIQK